jgi:EmrB/QacA subfamily drug resistance transporter
MSVDSAVDATVRPRVIAWIVACAMFMAQLDASVILVAVPQIAHAFAVRPVDLSSGIVSYILAQAVLLPASGWIADRFCARSIFVLALIGFTVTSILCGVSHTLPQFIGARVLQGFTAALMTPVARIMLLQSVGKSNLVAVMTISSVPMLVAPTVGPLVGGVIVTYLSWPWIFLLNVPVGLASIALALRCIPAARVDTRQRPFDLAGFLLVGVAAGGVLFSFDHMGTNPGSWAIDAALLSVATGFGVLAVYHLLRHSHPVLSLHAAGIDTYRITTLVGGALVRLPIRAVPFIIPLLLQVVLGYSPIASGFALLAMNGGDLLLKTAITASLRRFGFRTVMISSATTMIVTVAACAACAGLASPAAYWLIGGVLVICGMARSLLFSSMGSLAFADVPAEELSSASVLWNLIQQMTNALGISLAAILLTASGALLGERSGHVSVHDCQVALLAMALIGGPAIFGFLRLSKDAGAAMSGHGAHREMYAK